MFIKKETEFQYSCKMLCSNGSIINCNQSFDRAFPVRTILLIYFSNLYQNKKSYLQLEFARHYYFLRIRYRQMSPPAASARVLPRDRRLLAGRHPAIFLEVHLSHSQFLDVLSTIALMGTCILIRAVTENSQAELYFNFSSFHMHFIFWAETTNYRTINYAQILL